MTLSTLECTYWEYQASGIPCRKAIDFCTWNVQNFCGDYKKGYNEPIHPTLDHSRWEKMSGEGLPVIEPLLY